MDILLFVYPLPCSTTSWGIVGFITKPVIISSGEGYRSGKFFVGSRRLSRSSPKRRVKRKTWKLEK